MKASGVQLLEVHGSRKGLDPHYIPEKQPQPIVGSDIEKKPRLGQERAGWEGRQKLCLLDIQDQDLLNLNKSLSMMKLFQQQTLYHLGPIPEIPKSDVLPPYLLLQNRPPPKPPDQLIKKQTWVIWRQILKKICHFWNILYQKFMRDQTSYIFKKQLN